MNNKKTKLYTYKTLLRLKTRLRSDLKDKNFVLLYAYNGIGKTRLSMKFKEKTKKNTGDTLYFNAFTEDLFHWDNDLEHDKERYLIINEKSTFFDGFKELNLEDKIFNYLKRYADFYFDIDYDNWKITFHKDIIQTFKKEESKKVRIDNIKVSRGEENIFIWCIFLALCELAIDDTDNTGTYKWVKFLYIDDPVSSLDDNNAIAIASDLAKLLKRSQGEIKTVISSHHSLFFNVISNELKHEKHKKYFLHRDKSNDNYILQATNETPFFHHIVTLGELEKAVKSNKLYTHHFNMLRIVLEKTSTFFGADDFSYCINNFKDKTLYARALNLLSHGQHSVYEPREMIEDNKKLFKKILDNFLNQYKFDLPNIFGQQPTAIKGLKK